jgi:hypothetical protein
MKRGFGAALWVLYLGMGQVHGDYLEIKVDVKNADPYISIGTTPGQPGFPPQPGGFGNRGGQVQPPVGNRAKPPANPVPEGDHLWVSAYLEIKGKLELVKYTVNVAKLDHQFGRGTYIPELRARPGDPPPFMRVTKITKESPAREFANAFKKLKDAPSSKGLVKLALKAWSYGLLKEFHAAMDELKSVNAKHPAVTAYGQIQKQLKQPFGEEDPALKGYLDQLRSEGYRAVVSEQGHYTLYTNLPPLTANEALVKRRLQRLEETLEAFYYWFALQDKLPAPPMPRYRLLGLVVNDPDDFYMKHKNAGPVPILGDGFTPRRDNIMILSAKHLDEGYRLLEQKTQAWLRKITATQEEVLHGDIWKRMDVRGANAMPTAIIQTLVVVEKALADEAERATLSHEAVRQLLAASGLLPRQVAAPEWIQEGLASYFERPFGAVYGFGGLPSWSNLVAFKYYLGHGLGKGREILNNVITDRYFEMARDAADTDPNNDKTADKERADWQRARATSWALVYYLIAKGDMDKLLGYANEIAQMPRDLDLDEHALEACFAKAFGMADANDRLNLNPGLIQSSADSWIEFMRRVDLELPDVERSSMAAFSRRNGAGPKTDGPAPKGPRGDTPPPPLPPPPSR